MERVTHVAIGDIHGCVSELQLLIQRLKIQYDFNEVTLVFLGDYINRGGSSREVLEELIQLQQNYPHFVFLKGNHEHVLLETGGLLNSTPVENLFSDSQLNHRSASREIVASYLNFLRNLKPYYKTDKFLFTHGAYPFSHDEVENLRVGDLVWPRFVHPDYRGRHLVFGHVARPEIRQSDYWTCIDTGCYKSGLLTAALCDDKKGKVVDFVQVSLTQAIHPSLRSFILHNAAHYQ